MGEVKTWGSYDGLFNAVLFRYERLRDYRFRCRGNLEKETYYALERLVFGLGMVSLVWSLFSIFFEPWKLGLYLSGSSKA